MNSGQGCGVRKGYAWIKSMVAGVCVLLILSYVLLHLYMRAERQRIGAVDIKDTSQAISAMFDQREYYLMPDTAYLAKLEAAFYWSDRTLPGYPNKDMLRSIYDIKNNIKKGVLYNALIQSVYIMLEDAAAPYVLVNGDAMRRDDMHDADWMDTCRQMRTDHLAKWRHVPLSYTRSTRAFTTYARISSRGWQDGHAVSGYIVVNYHYDAMLNMIRAELREGETALLYSKNDDHALSIARAESKDGEALAMALEAVVRAGTYHKNSAFMLPHGDYIAHVADVGNTGLVLALAKEDVHMNRFMDSIRLSYALVIAALLSMVSLFFLHSQRQYERYIEGMVEVIHAVDSHQEAPAVLDKLPTLPLDTKNLHILAEKLLSHSVDISELRNTLLAERMQRAEIEMLYGHAQINSHFLLNTLDSIYWGSVRSRGFEDGQSLMIEKLCQILKYALDASSITAPLSDELAYAKEYLSIQQLRRKDAIHVTWDIPQEAKACIVSKLIMQPILENSIQHGARQGEDITIHISAFVQGELLRLRIEDDGHGISASVLAEMREQFAEHKPVYSRHIGMANVNRRLQVLGGDHCGIALSASSLGGLCVELVMQLP